MEATIKVNLPAGYELACDEMRHAEPGELYLSLDGKPLTARVQTVSKRIIVRKIKLDVPEQGDVVRVWDEKGDIVRVWDEGDRYIREFIKMDGEQVVVDGWIARAETTEWDHCEPCPIIDRENVPLDVHAAKDSGEIWCGLTETPEMFGRYIEEVTCRECLDALALEDDHRITKCIAELCPKWHIVTEEDRRCYAKPDCAQFRTCDGEWEDILPGDGWSDIDEYRVPRGFWPMEHNAFDCEEIKIPTSPWPWDELKVPVEGDLLSSDVEPPWHDLHIPVGCDLLDPEKCREDPVATCAVATYDGNPTRFQKCNDVECSECIADRSNRDALKAYQKHLRAMKSDDDPGIELSLTLNWSKGCPRYMDDKWRYPNNRRFYGFVRDGVAYSFARFENDEGVECDMASCYGDDFNFIATKIVFRRIDKFEVTK